MKNQNNQQKDTQGWSVIEEKSGAYGTRYSIGFPNYYPVTEKHPNGHLIIATIKRQTVPALSNEEREVAHLIAAAPDMLSELTGTAMTIEGIIRNMIDGIPVNIQTLESILSGHKKAIAKAEGRDNG